MYRDERRISAPVNAGEEISVNIEAVGEKGDGIAKVKGFVIFVPNTKVGDHPKVKVTRVLKKVAFAEVVGEGSVEASSESGESSEEGAEEEGQEEDEYQQDA